MVENIIEIKVTGAGTNLSPGGSSSGGSGAGGLLSAGGKLGMIAGAAMAVVSILKEMLWVFKPVQNILKMIARTLGLFLQPIAELLFLLIRPLLDFIRPLALLFRAMMMPVMGLLRQMSGLMSQKMASGDIAGATLVGLDMISLALGGFFIAMANVVGSMLIQVIGSLLNTLAGAIIDFGVLLLTPLTTLIDKFVPGISGLTDSLNTSADNLKSSISGKFQEGIAYAQLALTEGTTVMMDGWVSLYQDKYADLGIVLTSGFPEDVAFLEEVVINSGASIADSADKLNTKTNIALSNTDLTVDKYMGGMLFKGSIPSKFEGGLVAMEAGMDTFVIRAQDAGRKIASALSSAQSNASKFSIQIGNWGMQIR